MGRSVNGRENARQFKGAAEVDSGLLLTEMPDRPDTVPVEADFWWQYYCGLMIEGKCLSRFYIGSLKNFVMVSFLIELYETQINHEGYMYEEEDKKGNVSVVTNPKIDKLLILYEKHDKLAGSLGMTPYSASVNKMDLTGQAGPGSAPEPPPVDLERPTLPMTGTA